MDSCLPLFYTCCSSVESFSLIILSQLKQNLKRFKLN